jgi:MerR family copper efflux transcriptional regulator
MLNIRVRSKVKGGDSAELRIGELARQSGVASTALRYYEKAGLIPPPQRTASGYRAYDASVLPRLAFIRAAQAVGLSLAEIRDVIRLREGGSPPCRHVVDVIERHRIEVRARINELQRLEQDLEQLARTGAMLNPAECDPSGICAVIPTART